MKTNSVYLPFYSQQQYPRLLQIVNDRDQFDEKWEGWLTGFQNFKSDMDKKGFQCEEVVVDVEELNNYCVLNRLENNKTNRELFALKIATFL